MADQLQLRTQIELLKSRSLAERVIDEIGLYKPAALSAAPRAAQAGGRWPPAWADRLRNRSTRPWPGPVQGWGQLRALDLPGTQLKKPVTLSRAAAVAQFKQAVSGGAHPQFATGRGAGCSTRTRTWPPSLPTPWPRTFIATNIERKLHSSIYAREYLEDQIRQTKAKLEESERVINTYAKKNEILNLGDKGSAATQTFVDFSAALAKRGARPHQGRDAVQPGAAQPRKRAAGRGQRGHPRLQGAARPPGSRLRQEPAPSSNRLPRHGGRRGRRSPTWTRASRPR